MEWGKFGMAVGAVWVLLFLIGMLVSVISTLLQCGKTGWGASAWNGLKFTTAPLILFALAIAYTWVRNPFANTISGFGIPRESSAFWGVFYLVMIASWPAIVSAINSTAKTACVSTAAEITDFKAKLLAEMQTKEEEHQANATAKPT